MRSVPLSANVRRNVFRRLLIVFCVAIAAQIIAYEAVCSLMVAIAGLLPESMHVGVNIGVLVLRLAIALPIGFFGARLSYRAMRSSVPANKRMPVQPAIIAAAAAAGFTVIINWALRPEFATWATVGRDIAAALIWVFAAQRSFSRVS
jgi:hypothetical protein